MIKKFCAIFVASILIIGMLCNIAYATDITNKLDIVKQSAETKYLDNNQGYISKSIVDSDPEKGEVTIEVKLSNSKSSSSQTTVKEESYEIFLVIDDSGSMSETISTGGTRKNAVYEASKQLVENILENYSNVKIGIIKFGGKKKGVGVGTENDAEKMCDLSNDKDTIIKAIDTKSSVESLTNLEAGLILANKSFGANNVNKIVIALTDGYSNSCITDKDENGENLTVEQATKNKLIELDKSKINIISLLTEIEDEKTAEEIFGTHEKPTVGKYYYIADADIQKVITENIYSDVSQIISNPVMNNIKIVDYFPSDITENFEFEYVSKPNIGTIEEDGINEATNTITWNIEELKEKEEATIKYKLKLKDMQDINLLNKVISTNQKIVLTYKDSEEKEYEVVLSSSPEIKLSEVKQNNENKKNEEQNNENKNQDNSTSKNKLPATGESVIYISSILILAISILVIIKKLKNMKDIK